MEREARLKVIYKDKILCTYIPPSIVLALELVGFNYDIFPPWGLYKGNYGS